MLSDSSPGRPKPQDPAVNYESPPLVEIELDGVQYRVDAGKQGTALSVSTRDTGSWDWRFGGEAKWDGSALRTKAFERPARLALASALARALADLE